MYEQKKRFYDFGPYRLDPVKRLLLNDGAPVQLTPKAFDTLLVLIEERGHLLTKDELIDRVWHDSFVEEGNLTVTISMLRKALCENRGEHRYIVTAPGKGYRFVADVRELWDESTDLIVEKRTRERVVIEEDSRFIRQIYLLIASAFQRLQMGRRIKAVGVAMLVLVTAGAIWMLSAKPQAPTRAISLSSLQMTQLASWKTEPGAPVTIPRFSHDGKMVAFSSMKSGHSNIWIKQVMGGDQIQITKGDCNDRTPIWSPDDQQIAFISDRGDQEGIWSSLSHGSTPTLLKSIETSGSKHLRHWSKDGKTIYYELNHNLYALDIESKLTSQLTNFSSKAFSRDFAISPDENRIAYSDSKDGHTDIWVMPVGGGAPHQITNDAASDMYPAWHPDGQRIIYSSNHNGAFQICVAYLDGREPYQLTASGSDSVNPSVSPDGTRLLFHSINEESDLWRVRTDSGEESEITSEVGLEIWPDVSPDGKAIVFQSVGGSERLCSSAILAKAISADGHELQLAEKGFDARWSPDSTQVAFLRASNGKFSLWAINAAGGETRPLTPDGLTPPSFGSIPLNRVQDGGYSWSPDSSKIAYCSNSSNDSNLWTVSADGSTRTKVSDNIDSMTFFTRPLWSRDGSRLASVLAPSYFSEDKSQGWRVWINDRGTIFQYPDCLWLIGWSASGDSLIVASTENKNGLELTDIRLLQISATGSRSIAQLNLTYPDNLELSPDGRFVAFVSRQDDRDNVWVIATSGGPAQKLTTNTDPRLYLSALTWSPDGKAIYYSKQTRSSQVSMIENFK